VINLRDGPAWDALDIDSDACSAVRLSGFVKQFGSAVITDHGSIGCGRLSAVRVGIPDREVAGRVDDQKMIV
jgi:hypothetical protein